MGLYYAKIIKGSHKGQILVVTDKSRITAIARANHWILSNVFTAKHGFHVF